MATLLEVKLVFSPLAALSVVRVLCLESCALSWLCHSQRKYLRLHFSNSELQGTDERELVKYDLNMFVDSKLDVF